MRKNRFSEAQIIAMLASRRLGAYRRLGVLFELERIKTEQNEGLPRLFYEEGLTVRRKRSREQATVTSAPMALPVGPNQP